MSLGKIIGGELSLMASRLYRMAVTRPWVTHHRSTFEDDDWDPHALFATPQQWQLCHTIVNSNLSKTKLNILIPRLIVPDTNCKNPVQFYQLIADMEGKAVLAHSWEQSSVNVEVKATAFWYQKPMAVAQYILGHPPC